MPVPGRRRRLEACRRPPDDEMGAGREPRQRPRRVPPAPDGPREVAQPQRPVGLCDSPEGRRAAEGIRRPDSRAVPGRVGPFRRDEARRAGQPTLVPPHARHSQRVGRGQSHPAELRRRGLGHHCLGQWHEGGQPSGRIRPLHLRHHACLAACRPAGDRRLRVGPHRRGHAAAWQAGPPAPRHLVYGGDRHLADRLARTRESARNRRSQAHARPRQCEAHRRDRYEADPQRHCDGRSLGRRRNGRRGAGPQPHRGADRQSATVVARRSVPLRRQDHARSLQSAGRPRRGAVVFRHAEDLAGEGRGGHQPPVPQRQTGIPVRPTRSGLVA